MALSDPSWRVKTRPCPFYQQGRCLFSDSCNFLHTASATVIPEVSSQQKDRTTSIQPTDSQNLPRVVVDSPSSAQSPTLSVPISNLLIALQLEPADEDHNPTTTTVSEAENWSESLPTVVADTFTGYHAESSDDEDDELVEEGNWTAISDYDDSYDDSHNSSFTESVAESDPSMVIQEVQAEGEEDMYVEDAGEDVEVASLATHDNQADFSANESGLLSPIELSTLHLGPFRLTDTAGETASFDSGYADNWKPPAPLLASPPRSPSICSTFDLLSSPFGTHSSRVMSPRFSAFLGRSPVLSPARTVSSVLQDDVAPLDLGLDSPQEYYTALAEEQTVTIRAPMQPGPEIISSESNASNTDNSQHSNSSDLDSNTKWEQDDGVRQSTQSPIVHTEPLMEPVERQSTVMSPSRLRQSSLIGANATPVTVSESPLLAYLQSPAVGSSEDGSSVNSLYDIYSDIASPRDLISDSMRNAGMSPPAPEPASLSESSTPSSSLRERVFTPPPPQNPSNANSSFPSPMTSVAASSLGKESPPDESADDTQSNASKRIPFGFRNSFASVGYFSDSELCYWSDILLKQHRRNTFSKASSGLGHPPKASPFSPLHTHSSTSLSEPSHSATAQSFPNHNTGRGLKPLRLSNQYTHRPALRSFATSHNSNSSVHTFHSSGKSNHRSSISSSIVSSNESISNSRLLSSTRSPPLALSSRVSVIHADKHVPSPLSTQFFQRSDPYDEPQSAPPTSWSHPITYSRSHSRASEPSFPQEEDEDDTQKHDIHDETIRRPLLPPPQTAPAVQSTTSFRPTSLLTTPRPDLMFAIASDDVEQVRQVLEGGNAHPNDTFGPQSALEFTLTSDKLNNKLDIVKMLLAYGADVNAVKRIPVTSNEEMSPSNRFSEVEDTPVVPQKTFLETMDPATRPLARVRYELVGQDRALEQLFRVLSMQSRQISVTPMVVILCGPSGHGKSLLARKFGSLLDVPTHTVNMTTLKSTHDLWQSYSMSPYETPTTCTLAEFLINNEGKRCVVVLDEIEKADEKTLWSLLMPWEIGRCAFEASSRHVDVRNVIWLGTSNIGHDLVFQHRDARRNPDELMSREDYVELMGLLRPRVSERLGASIASRITTVLPFVPFTPDEKRAVAYEALFELSGDAIRTLAPSTVESIIDRALVDYRSEEGARSLSRAISNQLIDIL
ncbi:hypothetical protein CVT24_006802 [Panaeolus cyanescens]|uniref:C3H1-type domain-containing protein n=1 Tax=Panaeolus cyanescens TaxID=181874 RepID=A0A409VEC6_9AGAR|nr:hypothetical protein CVT24_006802 [Panaeolus cyanescens]